MKVEQNSPHSTLKGKLLRIVLGVLSLVALSILGLVSYLNMRTEEARLAEIEAQVRSKIESKAHVLVDNHALALRGLVADNVFSDVRALVERTVTGDEDILFGLFLAADGTPWIYSSPTTVAVKDQKKKLARWTELGLGPESATLKTGEERSRHLFGEDVIEVARPVKVDGESLGSVRYGFSTRQLKKALIRARAESQEALLTLLQTIAFCVVCCTLIGFVWVSRAATHIVSPLNELKRATDRIAAGESGVRVEVQSDDEVQSLALAFNGMQEANEDAMRRLSDAMDAALEASRLKSEFLANMSHEIRTPMNGVIGMNRLILQMPLEGKIKRYAETVDASANALMTIINDILDFSKMEAGKYEIQNAPFDPTTVAQEVVELLAGRAHGKGLELIYRYASDVPRLVEGDSDRYRQILNNLVGNAVKFTEDGEIFVEQTVQKVEDGSLLIHTMVQDTGMGIDRFDQEKLFSAFSQVDGSMMRKHGGTGLGLAISKRLTEMMGGEIGVFSDLGLGSRFWFTVRVESVEAPTDTGYTPIDEGRRALVVEGSRRWGQVIAERLEAWGIPCDVVQSSKAALEKVAGLPKSKSYDVAIVGTQLKDGTAREFVDVLRTTQVGQAIRLIALTKLGDRDAVEQIEPMIFAQLSKPVRFSELYDSVQWALNGEQIERRSARMRTAAIESRGQRILVVDDNEVNRFVVSEQLTLAGYTVDTAENGAIAVEKVGQTNYVLVFMDCQMPVLDGYAAAQEIRRAEEGTLSHVPIVALTAHALRGEREKVLAAGMDDYLSKPLRPKLLEKVLLEYTDGKERTQKPPYSERPSHRDAANDDFEVSLVMLEDDLDRSPRLIELFIGQIPDALDALDSAIVDDQSEVRSRAHKLKGSCLAVGAQLMAKEAEQLQHEAAEGDLSLAAERTRKLREYFSVVSSQLSEALMKGQQTQRASNYPS